MKSTILQEQAPRVHLLVFETGDEVKETLLRFARDHDLRSAHFKALGAVSRATLAYWNWDSRKYESFDVGEQAEVVSLVGNLARDGAGEPKLHAHVALGRRDGSLVGGHLMSGHVRPTLELVLEESRTAVVRRKDEVTGLELISL